MLRLFVGLALPRQIRRSLADLCHGIPDAAWTPEENLHLTLRFLGEVSESEAQDVDAALLGLDAPAFELTIKGIGWFGGHKPRLLYAGIAPEPNLNYLRDRVESAIARAGLPREERKFVPHVTLARLKGEMGHHLAQFHAAHNTMRLGPVEIDEVTLFRSDVGHMGSIYTPLVEYPLRLYA
ncbi:MAG: RNA 2',3'-cyclic phosphodiesterase [Alphaproteobacteria bacterium]